MLIWVKCQDCLLALRDLGNQLQPWSADVSGTPVRVVYGESDFGSISETRGG